MDFSLIATFFVLFGLELVLGVDNIIMVGVISGTCRKDQREAARKTGILMAAVGRVGLLLGVTWLIGMSAPLFWFGEIGISVKDLVLLAGGIFLLIKATNELHQTVLGHDEEEHVAKRKAAPLGHAILQICLLDLVFSIDSVITAVGLTSVFWVMVAAVLASACCVFVVSGPIIRYIRHHPALKVLALAFLLVIGVVIVMEAFHQHVPKTMIYLPMGFCLLVEFLQMSRQKNIEKAPEK